VRITLHVQGLDGKASFDSTSKARTVLEDTPVDIAETQTGSFYTAGAKAPVPIGPGFTMLVMDVQGAAKGAAALGTCYYLSEPPPPTGAFLPSCSSDHPPTTTTHVTGPGSPYRFGVARFGYEIPYAIGGWHATVSPRAETKSFTLWVPYT
jgi:hypothetical protein